MKKKFLLFVLSLIILLFSVFPYSKEVQIIVDSVINNDAHSSIEDAEKKVSLLSDLKDKFDLLVFIGGVQEALGLFEKACNSYTSAYEYAVQASQKDSFVFLIKAARCALSYGENQRADTYLAKAARFSLDEEYTSKVKLYAMWSWMSKIENEKALYEPIVILSSYVDLKGMESVQSSILLTLWYITGEEEYRTKLLNLYPSSAETAVVKGNAQLMPSPFWFFLPQKAVLPDSETTTLKNTTDVEYSVNIQEEKLEEESIDIQYYQLGFFRDKDNAQNLVKRLENARFIATIQEELRASGTTYYVVIVKENSSQTMGAELKNAGFESYPVYE